MASSADSQLRASYVVIALSFIGTCLLIWTVHETKKTAEAARQSVEVAQQGIALASRNAEKQLRAYVNVSSGRISYSGNVPTVHLAVKNFGQTPARQVVSWCDSGVGDLNLQFETTLEQTTNTQKSEYGVIGPTASITIQAMVTPLSPGAVSNMQEGKKAFYFWGEVRYIDVFDQRQTTKFRTVIMGREWLTNTDLGICHQGNDAT